MLPGDVMTRALASTLLWHTRLQGDPRAAGILEPYDVAYAPKSYL